MRAQLNRPLLQPLTGPRALVVQAVAEQDGAVTAERLVADLASQRVSRATIYRTLELLERRRLLTRMHLDSYHGYTVCEDSHHHHLLCSVCGRVAMVDAGGIEGEIQKLARELDFRLDTHTLEFSGGVSPMSVRSRVSPAGTRYVTLALVVARERRVVVASRNSTVRARACWLETG